MHMSSASPRGRTPSQPGEFMREYNKMDWIAFPWDGEKSCHCFRFKEKGWGNSKFCKIADSKVHRDPTVIYLFAHSINIRKVNYTFSRDQKMSLLRTGNELVHTVP